METYVYLHLFDESGQHVATSAVGPFRRGAAVWARDFRACARQYLVDATAMPHLCGSADMRPACFEYVAPIDALKMLQEQAGVFTFSLRDVEASVSSMPASESVGII